VAHHDLVADVRRFNFIAQEPQGIRHRRTAYRKGDDLSLSRENTGSIPLGQFTPSQGPILNTTDKPSSS
jgi:hypothetical protein